MKPQKLPPSDYAKACLQRHSRLPFRGSPLPRPLRRVFQTYACGQRNVQPFISSIIRDFYASWYEWTQENSFSFTPAELTDAQRNEAKNLYLQHDCNVPGMATLQDHLGESLLLTLASSVIPKGAMILWDITEYHHDIHKNPENHDPYIRDITSFLGKNTFALPSTCMIEGIPEATQQVLITCGMSQIAYERETGQKLTPDIFNSEVRRTALQNLHHAARNSRAHDLKNIEKMHGFENLAPEMRHPEDFVENKSHTGCPVYFAKSRKGPGSAWTFIVNQLSNAYAAGLKNHHDCKLDI